MGQGRAIVGIVCASVLGLGCDSEGSKPEDGDGDSMNTGTSADGTDGGTTGEMLDPNAPKYFDDVLPILIENCVGCHEEGGIGPFRLDDYETAKGIAEIIAISTTERTMPPFNASNTGECNTFQDARWLTDEQIDLIEAWAAGGAQAGDPATVQPPRPELEVLRGANIREATTPAAYLPQADASGPFDDHQCFLVDTGVGENGAFLTGFEVLPGNPAVAHHLVAFQVDPEQEVLAGLTNADIMSSLDNGSPDRPGWDCYGAAGNNVLVSGTPITWAPGGGAFNFPEGTGIRFEPGHKLVLQMHYNIANGSGNDQTRVRMSWADQVEREAVNVLMDEFLASTFSGSPFEIPANSESHVFVWDRPLTQWDSRFSEWGEVELLGMLPHMHEFGQRMQVTILRGGDAGGEDCGLYVDRWDFGWQQAFMYEQPLIVRAGDSIKVSCEWNTMGMDNPVTPGFGTGNEMCLLGLFAAPVR